MPLSKKDSQMKILNGLALALLLTPFALSLPEDNPPQEPRPSVEPEGKCCLPPYYVAPPRPFSCPAGRHCNGPTCSGTAGALLGGLRCIPDFGECDEEMETQWYVNIPVYTCRTRWIGNNICMQMYPKYECLWVHTGTGLGSYTGMFCGQGDDAFCI